ncbi:hypothetical protein [Roseimaritima ulvae]|uniref:Uncharacterized protein n=1 Tax=Roseimaritima ulvae TaxID=980254 RepID=A0A5B9R438_9BACT|nr:hypothetical protein [Roseimaritima ulvae]QEG41171.1 hypothetical protein UC8_31900 [Roseimaritima ulvae]
MAYCVHCGTEGAVAFCPRCGLTQSPESSQPAPPELPLGDWTLSVDYEHVLRHPEPQQRIATAQQGSREGITGENLLAVFDAVNPLGISFEKLAQAVVPICDKMGLHTGHQSQCAYEAPPGRLLVATLCTLAANALVVDQVEQQPDECGFTATIPSGMITNRGKLHVLVQDCQRYSQLSLGVRIAGQWHDWGKSKRMIAAMFTAVDADLREQEAGRGRRVA